MKLTVTPAALPLTLLPLLALPNAAQAQVKATFQQPASVFTSSLPQTVAVSATLTNNYAVPIYLNSDFSTADTPVTLDDSPFQNTFVFAADPVVLAATGGTFKGTVFDFVIPGGTAAGIYNAQFVLQGGADAFAATDLAETPSTFHLTVLDAPAAVPEASTTVSLGLLLVLGSAAFLARRRKTPA